MNTEQQELKQFLEQQLEWTIERVHILDEISDKLHEMKNIAELASTQNICKTERDLLNLQLNELKDDMSLLEKKLEMNIQ